jgi:hypothetical protein
MRMLLMNPRSNNAPRVYEISWMVAISPVSGKVQPSGGKPTYQACRIAAIATDTGKEKGKYFEL